MDANRAAERAQRLMEKLESKPENIRKEIQDVFEDLTVAILAGIFFVINLAIALYILQNPDQVTTPA